MTDTDVVRRARDVLARHDPDGRLPHCRLRRTAIGADQLDAVAATVAELLADGAGSSPGTDGERRPEVALLVDPVRILRDGTDVKQRVADALSGSFRVRRVVLDDGHAELHADEDAIARATAGVQGVAAVVSVGGGTITDIGKLASRDAGGVPFVVVQTAASVDGFTDDVSVVLRSGVKRTIPSRWPDVVISDVGTIAQAPPAMNRAGYGEINSMFTAPADWRLANLLGIDPSFHPAPIRLLEAVGEGIEEWSAGLGTDPSATERLTRALAMRGIVTGVSGSTASLSGVEHLVSHMFDLWNGQRRQPIGLHGAQVGVASVAAAAAWELLFERAASAGAALPDLLRVPDPDRLRDRVRLAFDPADPSGVIGAECWNDVSRKLSAVTAAGDTVRDVLARWEQHTAELRTLVRTPDDIARGLVAAGAAATFEDLRPAVEPDVVRWAVTNCALMRNRFTVVDLLSLLGWWEPDDVTAVLDRARSAATTAAVAVVDRG
ncbi:iron-containing alcohol dehydrogenase [Nakamurella endophytica]|uniref:Iron-containing alcohol dehydrogenase n=1 Tax=Nakamurella endophytica TaxID=1748367 RepID=A0A917SZQ6_9ACTN|nr:iron-containing alcohol dehydrogenase [Nakamurella endophytica]GGM05183.1 hypothetical protein GCM10011594_26770 [Nakamurella endophytica]